MGLRTDQLFFCTCPSPGRERVLVLSRRMVLHDLKDSAKICSSFFPLILALGFLKVFIYLFLERGEGREKEREKHQCVVASHVVPTGDLACNPGMCPDWELNWQPFASQLNPLSYTSQGQNFFIMKIGVHCRKFLKNIKKLTINSTLRGNALNV